MLIPYHSANDPNGVWELIGMCDFQESYRTNPIIRGSGSYTTSWSSETCEIVEFIPPPNPQGRFAWYLNTQSGNYTRQVLLSSGTQSMGVYYSTNGSGRSSTGQIPVGGYNDTYQTSIDAHFETNIPIFDSYEHKEAYVNARSDAEAIALLKQYAINRPMVAFFSCMGLPPESSAPEWLFNYENVVFNGVETIIVTDIDYDVATFGNKAWKFQFKWTVKDSRNGSSVALMGAGRNRWYGGNTYGYQTCFRDTNNNYTYFTNGNVNPGNDISIEYDGNGTINTYVNDVLNKTITNFEPEYLTGTPDSESKIFLGAWRNNQGNYSNVWNGTFEYIRMKFID